MTSRLVKVAGYVVRAMRTSFAGELGWQLHIPSHACESVYNVIWHEGLKYGIRHAGYRALYSLSCEKGTIFFSDLRFFLFFNIYVYDFNRKSTMEFRYSFG